MPAHQKDVNRANPLQSARVGANMVKVRRRERRLSVNVPQEWGEKYIETANRLNLAVSSFVGLLAAIGYDQLLENPELLTKAMQE